MVKEKDLFYKVIDGLYVFRYPMTGGGLGGGGSGGGSTGSMSAALASSQSGGSSSNGGTGGGGGGGGGGLFGWFGGGSRDKRREFLDRVDTFLREHHAQFYMIINFDRPHKHDPSFQEGQVGVQHVLWGKALEIV